MSSEVQRLVESVERSRATLCDAVSGFSSAQAAFRPADGQWSIAEILEHLYLAEMSGITKIWAAAEQRKAGHRWDGALPNHGKPIEDVIATTWKTREAAPAIATPHIGGPLASWVSSLRSLRTVLQDLADELEELRLEEIVFPHYLSGPLDGRQRLEFLRFHIDRHRAQIERVRNSPGFPAA